MDETTFRILDTLTRNLGGALSIQDLTREMRRLHGSAYYANVYRRVQDLKKQGLLQLGRTGRTSLVSLAFGSYPLLDALTEMELRRKRAIMDHHGSAVEVFEAVERALRGLPIACACTIDTARTLRLRRVEILIIAAQPEAPEIPEALENLARHLSLRVDHLSLSAAELVAFLGRRDRNQLPAMLRHELGLYLPQHFWAILAEAAVRGQRLQAGPDTDLRRLGEADLAYNLGRFGYPLFGRGARGDDLSIEATTIAALLSQDHRRRAGAAVLLAKNDFHSRLLAFLALRHGIAGDLLGLLGTLKSTPRVKKLQRHLERARVHPVKPDAWTLQRTKEVYDAAG